MDVMREFPDKHFDLAIVDPPYGIGQDGETDSMVTNNASGKWKGARGKGYVRKEWDKSAPTKEYFNELSRVSKKQIIWGGNYFPLPPARCWTIWDKEQSVPNFAAAELAWTSFDEVVRQFRFSFSANRDKIHVTQKPVALYDWLLATFAKPGQKILDTHLGSGSHAIACHYFGAHLTACEIDPDYYAAAMERIRKETAQGDFFTPVIEPETMAQEVLAL